MNTPLICLSGAAGSGKSTVATLMEAYGCVQVGIADPIKQLAIRLLEFSESQLWGASPKRSEPDARFNKPDALKIFEEARRSINVYDGKIDRSVLVDWLRDLRDECGSTSDDFQEDRKSTWVCHKALTPRHALQTLGAAVVKDAPDHWIREAIEISFRLLDGGYRYRKDFGVVERRLGKVPDPKYVVLSDGRLRHELLAVKREGGTTIRIFKPTESPDQHRTETEMKSIPDNFFDSTIVTAPVSTDALAKMVKHIMQDLNGDALRLVYHADDF